MDAWRLCAAKGLSLIVAPLLIAFLFYGYTYFLGRNLLVLDITIFRISVACSQLASIWLLQLRGTHPGKDALLFCEFW